MSSDPEMRTPPPYAVSSVDHALRIAVMLQMEGKVSVTQVAARLGVARSTAHRLLAMLVYRDFAIQDESRTYRVGPVLRLPEHSRSLTARMREAAFPHLRQVVRDLGESANLFIRAGATSRCIASVECGRALRVSSREGVVFPVHRTSAGLLLLAELAPEDLPSVFADEDPEDRPDLARLGAELARIRRAGFAVNRGRSERGIVAVGVPLRAADGEAVAGLCVSMPSVRYARDALPRIVQVLRDAAHACAADLGYR
ncbi:IclR family transcriptional regulator [Nocardioides sp. LHD-245]|uniref:IclR family transcriptional regulator n=1 Tax=Nocardioides sp. LHD-245 TaxID=3051387 RepID=UPI0027E19EC6|nr:IclR family transcriptional regulator [Nocardioides sp. LHD-245]